MLLRASNKCRKILYFFGFTSHSIVPFYCVLFVLRFPSIILFYCTLFVPKSPLNVNLHRVFPNDIMVAISLLLNKEIVAMLVPSRIEFYFYANSLFWFGFKTTD